MAGAIIAAAGTRSRPPCATASASSRPICAGMATAPGPRPGTTPMASYVYDLAQLIHAEIRAAGLDRRALAGRQHRAALRRASIRRMSRRLVAIEGMGPGPGSAPARRQAGRMRGCAIGSSRPRAQATRGAVALSVDRGGAGADAGGQQAPDRGGGAASDRARRQPQRRRHLVLEVRSLCARLATGRSDARGDRRAVGKHRMPDPAGLWPGELGDEPGTGRTAGLFPQCARAVGRRRRTLGAPRPAGEVHRRGGEILAAG